jgi:hypothetical protein
VSFGKFYGYLLYFVYLYRYIFPVLVFCTKKNLATLVAGVIERKTGDNLHYLKIVLSFFSQDQIPFFREKSFREEAGRKQGCQMVSFQTKNPNWGIFWRTLEWKMLLYTLVIYNILRPLGIFYGHLIIL